MRESVRRRRYVMTAHADEEADEYDLSVLDIESVVLTGAVVERQEDRETPSCWPLCPLMFVVKLARRTNKQEASAMDSLGRSTVNRAARIFLFFAGSVAF